MADVLSCTCCSSLLLSARRFRHLVQIPLHGEKEKNLDYFSKHILARIKLFANPANKTPGLVLVVAIH